HPIGQLDAGTERDGFETSNLEAKTPPYAEVLEVRADRVAMVRDFLATVTADDLAGAHPNPHQPKFPETTCSCLHVIPEEEWEHHRDAVRDLDTITTNNS